ncbi:MAG: hypothetical protein PXZ07_04400 [Candidatus Eremiobacteraeota bacterium]|nr:hypothetical protein [Candidatus Eremiobacteraeota bacterium]
MRSRTLPVLGFGILATALFVACGGPAYSTLFTNLSASNATAVIGRLKDDKIPYHLSLDGKTIRVPIADVRKERASIARAGVIKVTTQAARAAENAASEQETRVSYHVYWASVTKSLAEAHRGMLMGLQAAKSNDSVAAWKDFSACAKLAEMAGEASVDNVPADWSGDSDTAVGGNLTSAASGLEDACQSMASYVDDQKPSDLADEQSNTQSFVNGIVIATHSAEAWYVKHGGKASDITNDL